MPSAGIAGKDKQMAKWIIVSVAAAIFVVGAALCVEAVSGADVVPGVFQGVSSHEAAGHVEIVKVGDITKVVLKDDFTLQDAPAPRLALGKDGYKRGTSFATLAKFKGAQDYVVPAVTDLSKYNEVWIWCEKFDVPLAVAKIK